MFFVTAAASPGGPALAVTGTAEEYRRRRITVTLPDAAAAQTVTLHTATAVPGRFLPPLTAGVAG